MAKKSQLETAAGREKLRGSLVSLTFREKKYELVSANNRRKSARSK